MKRNGVPFRNSRSTPAYWTRMRLPIKRLVRGTLGIALLAIAGFGGWYWLSSRLDPNPDNIRIETADVDRFLALLDSLPQARTAADSTELIDKQYLSVGTPGLRTFNKSRIGGATPLQRQIESHRDYYQHLAQSLGDVESLGPGIREALRHLKVLHPQARFADVYLLVGRMNSGGTTAPGKLLIGAEMYARDDATPTHELSTWEQSVLRDNSLIPTIVTHEMIHLLQPFQFRRNLLEQSLREGGADFVAELVTGKNINAHVHTWAADREKAIWAEFETAMQSSNVGPWFFSPPADRPADLGYYVGYRISQAYYRQADDKEQAIAEIIGTRDADALLAASGYSP